MIRNLNPRPLNGYGGDRAQYVFPDKKVFLQYTTTSPKLHKALGVPDPAHHKGEEGSEE